MADREDLVELVAEAHGLHLGTVIDWSPVYGWRCPCGAGRGNTDGTDWDTAAEECRAHSATAILDALAEAGALLPPGGVIRERWRHRDLVSGGSIEVATRERLDAWHTMYCAAPRSPLEPAPHPCRSETATETTWPDGTTLTGPWQEVPTNEH